MTKEFPNDEPPADLIRVTKSSAFVISRVLFHREQKYAYEQ
jgi:hypothetical protein